jgi:hypothetical protein
MTASAYAVAASSLREHRDALALPVVADREVRAALRRQIARLDRELGRCEAAPAGRSRLFSPRLLTTAELEAERDALAGALVAAQRALGEREADRAEHRALLERVREDPRGHKFVRIPLAALGEPGCGAYEVRPRLGIVGMLAGWWEVKLSSGCPLPQQGSRGSRVRILGRDALRRTPLLV